MAENIADKYTNFSANANGVGIHFLQGTQTQLNKLMSDGNAVEGTFYLTSDTQRLYVGRKQKSGSSIVPVPVNEGITTVTNVAALPNTANVGDFYYAEAENILAVCVGTDASSGTRKCTWAQLNTNTHLETDSLEHTIAAVTNGATINTTITDSGNNVTTDAWQLLGGDNVTVETNSANKTITLKTTDTTYTFSTKSEGTELSSKQYLSLINGTNEQLIEVQGERVKVDASQTGKLKLTGQQINGTTATAATGADTGWHIGVTVDGSDAPTKAKIDPIIEYGSGTTKTTAKFSNGKATLNVYTTTEADKKIDEKIKSATSLFDAMTFKGVITTAADIPAFADSSNGDTYKIGADGIVDNTVGLTGLKKGDLLIAVGTELATGKLDPTKAEWEVIPAGDEATVTGALITNGIQINSGTSGSTAAELVSIDFEAGSLLTIAESGTGTRKHITFAHQTVTSTDTRKTTATVQTSNFTSANASNDFTFYVLDETDTTPAIVRDAHGHVTEVKTKKVTVKDTHSHLNTFSTYGKAGADSKTVSVVHYAMDSDGFAAKEATTNYKSETLTLKASTSGTAKKDGAQAAVQIELMWGTF